MNNALVKRELSNKAKEIWNDVLLVIKTSSISSADEISDMLNVDSKIVLELLNDEEFYNTICANSLANMRLAYHSKAIPILTRKLNEDNNFYDSYDRLTKAIGAVSQRDNEGMKLSLEVLLKNNNNKEEKDISSHTKGDTIEVDLKKVSGNIFEIQDTSRDSTSSHKTELQFDFED